MSLASTSPPPNAQDNATNNMFHDEITELLTALIPKYNNSYSHGRLEYAHWWTKQMWKT